jgi:hypothetical protein
MGVSGRLKSETSLNWKAVRKTEVKSESCWIFWR